MSLTLMSSLFNKHRHLPLRRPYECSTTTCAWLNRKLNIFLLWGESRPLSRKAFITQGRRRYTGSPRITKRTSSPTRDSVQLGSNLLACPFLYKVKYPSIMYTARPSNTDVSKLVKMVHSTLHNNRVESFAIVVISKGTL